MPETGAMSSNEPSSGEHMKRERSSPETMRAPSLRYRVRDPRFEPAPRKRFGSPRVLLPLLLMMAAIIGVVWLALQVREPLQSLFLLLMMFGAVSIIGSVLLGPLPMRPGRIRPSTEGGALRFRSNLWFLVPLAVGGLFMLAAGALGLYSRMLPDLAPIGGLFGSRGIGGFVVLVSLGGALLLDALVRARPSSGLRLSSEGLEWGSWSVRGIAWEQIQRVSVVKGVLRLELIGGSTVTNNLLYVGSDPLIVAESVRYFAVHAEHRDRLSEPGAALRLVVEPADPPHGRP